MSSPYTGVLKKEYKPKIESLKDDFIARRNPDFFWPTGTQVYVGRQGSGKTISAVKHLLQLHKRYPKAKIVTNLNLNYLSPIDINIDNTKYDINTDEQYFRFNTMEELSIALTKINNGYYGVIYIIDEIHTYFNALESKNIPMYVFTEISQQRKQRKLIIGTSQLFLRMAKPLREQCDNLIMCTTKLGVLTFQKAYDGMTLTQDYNGDLVGDLRKKGRFFHTRHLRGAFDTYQKVVSGEQQFETINSFEINSKGKNFVVK